jgi:TBC1 domain family member 2
MVSPYSPRSLLRSRIPDAVIQRERLDLLLIQESPSLSDLKKLAWKGCSAKSRAAVWRMLVGYEPLRYVERRAVLRERRLRYRRLAASYDKQSCCSCGDPVGGIETSLAIMHQIDIDLPRTCPGVALFHSSFVRQLLRRVLFLFAIHHPEVGYVQGMNEIVVPILIVFIMEQANPRSKSLEGLLMQNGLECNLLDGQVGDFEADTYWTFSIILERVLDNFTNGQPGMHGKVHQLERVVAKVDPALFRHFADEGCKIMQFGYRWIAVLMLREFNISLVIPLWDVLLARTDGFCSYFVVLSASFLLNWRDELLALDFQGMMTLLLNLPTGAWIHRDIDMLVSQADTWLESQNDLHL